MPVSKHTEAEDGRFADLEVEEPPDHRTLIGVPPVPDHEGCWAFCERCIVWLNAHV